MSEELKPPRFPTMLRKMWSGSEVQAWIDDNWNRRAQPEPAAPAVCSSCDGTGKISGLPCAWCMQSAAPSVAPEPVAWTLQSELDAAQTTCSAHLWFTNPRNSAWTALFTREKSAAHPPRAPLTPGCRTPEGCSENGCLGWCDEHKPEVATRCEGCAELRDQLRDLMRQSKAAQIDAENLREVLHRMLEAPTTQISAGWKDAIRQAMSAAVPDSKTPNAGGEPETAARTNL